MALTAGQNVLYAFQRGPGNWACEVRVAQEGDTYKSLLERDPWGIIRNQITDVYAAPLDAMKHATIGAVVTEL